MEPPVMLDTQSRSTVRGEHGRYGTMTVQVAAFFAQLRRIPLDWWLRSAEGDPHGDKFGRPGADTRSPSGWDEPETDADQAARARLREVMDTMPQVARRIRRHIDGEITILEGLARPAARARMARVARLAACAVAARPYLSPSEFERLYRPFEDVIPVSRLTPS